MGLGVLPALLLSCQGAPPADVVRPPAAPVTTADTATPAPSPALQLGDTRPHNLLMISVDTLRTDHVGPRPDGSPSLTPFYDALAAQGLVLAAHHSCSSWTYPSVACAMAGRSGIDLGYIAPVSSTWDTMPADVPFLPDWTAAAGYASAIATGNTFLCSNIGIADTFDANSCMYLEPAAALSAQGLAHLDDLIASQSPWFLHIHYMDPHSPYDPPQAYLEGLQDLPPAPVDLTTIDGTYSARSVLPTLSEEEQASLLEHIRIRYEGEVRYFDDQLAVLWNELQDRDALDDTLVVFWSDHGEQLFDRGAIGHGKTLHVEENDATAMFWARGLEPGVWPGKTTHADLVPTLLDALQLDMPPEVTGTVVGLRPADAPVFGLLPRDGNGVYHAAMHDDLRLVYHWNTGDKALYRTTNDPGELTDTYDPEDPAVIELWRWLEPEVWAATEVLDDRPVAVGP